MSRYLPSGTAARVVSRLKTTAEHGEYLYDPTAWLEDELGWVWSAQADIADSVCDNRHTAVHSCHASGKSWLAAGLVCWWLDVHPRGEAFAVTTAPTQPQVEAILWREIGKMHRTLGLDGYITAGNQPQWKLPSGELIAFGRKPADYIDVEQAKAAYQGIHARYVLVVLDEAAGVPAWLWDAVESLVTNQHARILAIGNPDDPTSQFAKVCSPGSGWNVFHIDALATPNFTGEEVPPLLADLLVSPVWVEERRKRWGEGAPMWESRVRGLFPQTATDTLISPDLILAAQHRDLSHAYGTSDVYGVDVARSGTDESAIYRKRGGVVRHVLARAGINDTMLLAGEVASRIGFDGAHAVVDIIGIGAGVYDRLAEQGLNVTPFQASEAAYRPEKFKNKRAEQYWAVRQLFIDGAIDIAPEDDELATQLGAIKWKIDSAGRIQIESKEDMKKRGIASPDRADALVLACYHPPWWPVENVRPRKRVRGIMDDILDVPW